MISGSMTVDLATEAMQLWQEMVWLSATGVTCIGYIDLPSRLAAQSPSLYCNNIYKFVLNGGAQHNTKVK